WIWDCGHWTTGNRITGERTEFHPLNGIVVTRRSPYRTRGPESQTDAFISSDGNLAHAVEECARTHQPIAPDQYGPDLRTCIQTPGNTRQPLSSVYTFFVPALPSGSTPRPGLWNLYLDVNGYWKLLNDWAPGLGSVVDGQRLRLNRSFTIEVPRGRGVSLLVHGRECDEPSQQVVGGELVPIVRPCPVNREEFQLANDDTGTILDNYRSANAALGV